MHRTVPTPTRNAPDTRRRDRAMELLSGVISVALLSGLGWWFLEVVADSVAVI